MRISGKLCADSWDSSRNPPFIKNQSAYHPLEERVVSRGQNIQSETHHLREKLKNYKAGSIEGLDTFSDAADGEMEGLQIRLAVFGMTGAGKSSLVNTVLKTLYGKDAAQAIVQSSGAEGTQLLEDFCSRAGKENELGGFVFSDTRGFNFDFSNAEESESAKVCVFFCKISLC